MINHISGPPYQFPFYIFDDPSPLDVKGLIEEAKREQLLAQYKWDGWRRFIAIKLGMTGPIDFAIRPKPHGTGSGDMKMTEGLNRCITDLLINVPWGYVFQKKTIFLDCEWVGPHRTVSGSTPERLIVNDIIVGGNLLEEFEQRAELLWDLQRRYQDGSGDGLVEFATTFELDQDFPFQEFGKALEYDGVEGLVLRPKWNIVKSGVDQCVKSPSMFKFKG